MTPKNFPEKFCVKGHPLLWGGNGGVCKGGNGGRGYGGRGTLYIQGEGYVYKKTALLILRRFLGDLRLPYSLIRYSVPLNLIRVIRLIYGVIIRKSSSTATSPRPAVFFGVGLK